MRANPIGRRVRDAATLRTGYVLSLASLDPERGLIYVVKLDDEIEPCTIAFSDLDLIESDSPTTIAADSETISLPYVGRLAIGLGYTQGGNIDHPLRITDARGVHTFLLTEQDLRDLRGLIDESLRQRAVLNQRQRHEPEEGS